jgi:hypothetical protein
MLWKFLLISLKATCLSFAPASSTLINASPISDFEKSQVPDSLYVKDSATKNYGVFSRLFLNYHDLFTRDQTRG